jgi:hypothetical protein
MIQRLVANGCSYMDAYCQGLGHVDLAHKLGINRAHKLAVSGCANPRIIRSTLKHSYSVADAPTLYILGMTFMSRWELPINSLGNEPEGRWVNPQAREPADKWQFNWTEADTNAFKELQFKAVSIAEEDQLEDLMYRLVSMLHDLRSRGHNAVIYNQADASILEVSGNSKFKLLHSDPSFINGLGWLAIPWQQQQGAPVMAYPPEREPPMEFRHIAPGKHQYLNTYLTNYIQEHKILT